MNKNSNACSYSNPFKVVSGQLFKLRTRRAFKFIEAGSLVTLELSPIICVSNGNESSSLIDETCVFLKLIVSK